MNKKDFLLELHKRLSMLSNDEAEKSIAYYSEIIDDRVEGGEKEDDVIASLGSVRDIADRILMETPITSLVKGRVKPKRKLRTWEIILIAIGSPIWLSLLIGVFAIALSVYVSICAVAISLCAVTVSFILAGLGGIVFFAVFMSAAEKEKAFLMLGAGLVLCGLGILLIKPMCLLIKGVLFISKHIPSFIKRCIIGKGEKK